MSVASYQQIGNWNTTAVTDMRAIFRDAAAIIQSVGNWNTTAVTDFSQNNDAGALPSGLRNVYGDILGHEGGGDWAVVPANLLDCLPCTTCPVCYRGHARVWLRGEWRIRGQYEWRADYWERPVAGIVVEESRFFNVRMQALQPYPPRCPQAPGGYTCDSHHPKRAPSHLGEIWICVVKNDQCTHKL